MGSSPSKEETLMTAVTRLEKLLANLQTRNYGDRTMRPEVVRNVKNNIKFIKEEVGFKDDIAKFLKWVQQPGNKTVKKSEVLQNLEMIAQDLYNELYHSAVSINDMGESYGSKRNAKRDSGIDVSWEDQVSRDYESDSDDGGVRFIDKPSVLLYQPGSSPDQSDTDESLDMDTLKSGPYPRHMSSSDRKHWQRGVQDAIKEAKEQQGYLGGGYYNYPYHYGGRKRSFY